MKGKIEIMIFCIVIYLILLIVQIVLLICSIKNNKKIYWRSLFLIEIISIIANCWFMLNDFPESYMFAISSIGYFFLAMGGLIIYSIMLFITICARVIIFEKNEKEKQRASKNPIILILAITLISLGIFSIIYVMFYNFYIRTTIGTVIGFEEESFIIYEVDTDENRYEIENYYAIVLYEVDDEEYQDDYIVDDSVNIGDEIRVYYYSNSKTNALGYIDLGPVIFAIPLFFIGFLLLFIRFKGKIIKCKIKGGLI